MNTFAHLLGYLVDLFTALLGSVLLLRAWVYAQAIPTADPIARFCIALTDWLVLPVAKTMRASGKWHWPAILSAFGVAILSSILLRLLFGIPMSILGLVVSPFALLIRWGTEMVLWGTMIWVVLSWLQSASPVTRTLGYLVDPFLRPARRLIPMIKGFDLSPILVFILCQVILIIITPLARGII